MQRLGNDRVGTRIHVREGTGNRALETLDGTRIRARHDHEIGIEPRVHGRPDTPAHRVYRSDLLVVQVAAPLGFFLVLDVHAADTHHS